MRRLIPFRHHMLTTLCLMIVCWLPSGCTSLTQSLKADPNVKVTVGFQEIKVAQLKSTRLEVKKGQTVIITPLYPKGYMFAVKGKIGDSGPNFYALDVDFGDIYTAQQSGALFVGLDEKAKPVKAGVFVFNQNRIESIIADLNHIHGHLVKADSILLTNAILHMRLGSDLTAKGKYPESLEAFDAALQMFKKLDEKTYAVTISRIYKSLAHIHQQTNNPKAFKKCVSQSLEVLMQASQHYPQMNSSRFAFLNKMTQEERYLLLTKTRFIPRSSAEAGNDHSLWGFDYRNPAVAYAYIGRYYADAGNLKLSQQYCQKAVDVAIRTDNNHLISYMYSYLGLRHLKFGYLDNAEAAFEKSLSLSEKLRPRGIARQLLIYVQEKKGAPFDQIETAYQEALRAYSGFKITPRYIKMEMGEFYINRGKYDQAVSVLKSAYYSFANDRYNKYYYKQKQGEVFVLLTLVQAYLNSNKPEEALPYLTTVEADLEAMGNPDRLTLFLDLQKANYLSAIEKDPTEPLLQAIARLEEIRPTATSNATDYQYWERMISVYDRSIGALYRQGQYDKSLEIAEKARSRRFLDHLGGKQLGGRHGTDASFKTNASLILQSVTLLEEDMIQSAQESGIKLRQIYQDGTRYTKKVEAYTNAIKRVSESDYQLGLAYNVIPASPDQVQKRLPAGTLVLEYYVSDEAIYTWVIGRDRIKAQRIPIPRAELKQLITEFRSDIRLGAVKRGIAPTGDGIQRGKDLKQKLYDLLILPVEKELQARRVIIIPYGILNYLPFQALHDGRRYMVEKYAISYLPCLSVLEFIADWKSSAKPAILAFGNPDLGDAKLDLPAAEQEVEIIKNLYPTAKVLKRRAADEATAKRLMQQYNIIHFASHGEYVPEAPLYSCLRLAPGKGEDGRLEAEEIFDLNLDATMVVTSACQTAVGRIGKGDEVIGLTRAFLYAGAESVLGSLWSISDEATAVLMREFYANIGRMEKHQALRKAQLKMLKSEEYRDPFYWAAFNLTGGL